MAAATNLDSIGLKNFNFWILNSLFLQLLIRLVNQQVLPSCDLYRQYFSDRLTRLRLNLLQEHRLATIIFVNVVDFAAKMATDPEQTQNLLYQDFHKLLFSVAQFQLRWKGRFFRRFFDSFPWCKYQGFSLFVGLSADVELR